jgi:ABC-2 type transport system ATP-binding protein
VLLTTQYLEEADRLAQDIAVIDNGEVIARGTPTELKTSFGATVVEIGFAAARTATRANKALATFEHREMLRDGITIEVKLEDGPKGVPAVVRALDAAKINPERFIVREPTLDDVFLSLTGHAAEAAPGDDTDDSERGAA